MPDETLKVLIVDDEPLARRFVRDCLVHHRDMEIIGEARNGLDAIRKIEDLEPDLLFLDIKMPGRSGLQVLGEIVCDQTPLVIFTTAFDQYAVEAFEQEAIDYLLKPFSKERFDSAIDKVRKLIESKLLAEHNRRLRGLLSALDKGDGNKTAASDEFEREPAGRLRLKTGFGTVIINTDEINRVESDSYLLSLFTDSKRYSITGTMNRMESCLDPTKFVRIHRKIIVNIARVESYHATGTGTFLLRLDDGTELPLSRRRKEHFETHFGRPNTE